MREDLLKSHFKDTATWKQFKNINQYNERVYENEQTISCRKVKKTQVIKSANNEDIISTITIYPFSPIGENDNIDGKDVLAVSEWKSLFDNEVVAYRVLIWVGN